MLFRYICFKFYIYSLVWTKQVNYYWSWNCDLHENVYYIPKVARTELGKEMCDHSKKEMGSEMYSLNPGFAFSGM